MQIGPLGGSRCSSSCIASIHAASIAANACVLMRLVESSLVSSNREEDKGFVILVLLFLKFITEQGVSVDARREGEDEAMSGDLIFVGGDERLRYGDMFAA